MFIYSLVRSTHTIEVPQGTEYCGSPFEVCLVNEKILSRILVLTVANWEHSVDNGGNRCTAYIDTYVGGMIPLAQDIVD